MSCSDAARAAIELLRRGWTRAHEPAVDADGRPCASWGDAAVAWTLWGAASGARGVTDQDRLRLFGKLKAVTGRADPRELNRSLGSADEAIAIMRRCVEDET